MNQKENMGWSRKVVWVWTQQGKAGGWAVATADIKSREQGSLWDRHTVWTKVLRPLLLRDVYRQLSHLYAIFVITLEKHFQCKCGNTVFKINEMKLHSPLLTCKIRDSVIFQKLIKYLYKHFFLLLNIRVMTNEVNAEDFSVMWLYEQRLNSKF